jgi:uncharacterized LabA/DUF88 family protein
MGLERLSVYVDGFNLYFGMRDAKLMRSRWLDLVSLSRSIADGRHVEMVHYYTARVRRPTQSNDRQAVYLDALEAKYPDVFRVHHGFMQWEPWDCKACGAGNERRQEKQTDVNLAVDVVQHAHRNAYDTAIIVSGDSDLRAAVVASQSAGKRVIVGFPPLRVSDQLADVADGSFVISNTKIRTNQLPADVAASDGSRTLSCPTEWLTDETH